MASGHVNRANRPNTWLHRPTLQREESPCQSGAVHTWHKAASAARAKADIRCQAAKPANDRSGHWVAAHGSNCLSFSHSRPLRSATL